MTAARYWRVYTAATNASVHFSVCEVAFLGSGGTDLSVGGVALASSEYSSAFVAANAFDKNPSQSSRWATTATAVPAWIGYNHPTAVSPVGVRIVCDNDPANFNNTLPRNDADVSVQYSADGATWRSAPWRRASGDWTNGATVLLDVFELSAIRAIGMPMDVYAKGGSNGALNMRRMRPINFRDMEFGGTGRIWGTNEIETSPNVRIPTGGRVVLLRQRDKLLVRETWANPITGAWEFKGIDATPEYLVLAEDLAGNYRPVAASKLVAEVTP